MLPLAVVLLLPIVLLVGGAAWYLARRFHGWGRLAIVLLVPLPLPILIFAASIVGMIHGWQLPGNECSLNACGGYMVLGVMGIVLTLGAFAVGVPAAIFGVFLARRDKAVPARELRDSFE